MILYGDYHTHTTYSHGTGSILENAIVAKHKGLKEIAITDHGFSHFAYGMKVKDIEKMRKECMEATEKTGVNVLLGVEANFVSMDGSIDLNSEQIKLFDIILCGHHRTAVPKSFKDFFQLTLANNCPFKPSKQKIERNTNMILKALDKYPIDVLTHPCYKIDIDLLKVARKAKETGTKIELNGKRINFSDDMILKFNDEKIPMIINSDAHSSNKVGECNLGINKAFKLDINKDLLANVDKLLKRKK